MTFALTLSRYLGRVFAVSALSTTLGLTFITSLFDYIDLLRRAASQPQATFAVVTEIEAMRLPFAVMEILPFGILLGGILAFWRLARSSELVVTRAAGLSAWEFLAAPLACAFLFGAFATTVLSPVSSAFLARAERLDTQYLQTSGADTALAGGPLWMRQSDRLLVKHGVAILHVQQVWLRQGVLHGQQASVFRLGPDDKLLQRIEAPSLSLSNNSWKLADARVIAPDSVPSAPHDVVLPTDLSLRLVRESFSSPDTLSFWQLPAFIRFLKKSGFSTIRHRLHFQALLALPLLAATMALLSAGFSMRSSRRGGAVQMLGGGVAAGFALFVISKIASEFGQTGVLPTFLAAWAPAAVGLMLAVSLLLHLEDG